MADTASPDAAPATDRAAEQARIRKERREAKIKAGSSARLNKITGLGGGVQRGITSYSNPRLRNIFTNGHLVDAPPQPTVTPAGDPEEVDISASEHFYQPNSTPRQRMNMNTNAAAQNMNMNFSGQQGPQMSDEQLRQMMLGFPPAPSPNNANGGGAPPNPFAGFPGMEGMGGPGMAGMEDDPMMKMMQQLLSGGNGGGMGGMPGLSEGMNGMPSFPGMSTTTAATDPYAYIWRIVHAIFALSLGLYISLTTTFTGTKLEREQSIYNNTNPSSDIYGAGIGGSVKFFWIFATMEIVLQTSRFFFDQGAIQHAGWMGTVVGLLPEPWKGYVLVLSRYARIWTTLRNDVMALVFVLGVCAWWRGGL